MKSSLPTKPLLDVFMAMLFLLLMADRHTGNDVHEYLGLVLAGGVLLHVWLNRRWVGVLLRGRYDLSRFIRFMMNLLLFAAFIGTLASAAVISKTVFSFLSLKGELFSRTLHVFFAHWSFLLAAVHLGLYWKKLAAMLNRYSLPSYVNRTFFIFADVAVTAYGAYAFIQRELIYPMTMRSAFMMWSENDGILLFLMDYGAIFFLCAWAAYSLSRLMGKRSGPVLRPAEA